MIVKMLSRWFERTMAIVLGVMLASAPLAATAQQAFPGMMAQDPSAMPADPAAQPAPDAPTAALASGYVLGAGDIIEVSVVGSADYRARVQVQTDGMVQLPYLRAVPATGTTVLQFQDDVARRLQDGGYYTDPVVSVMVASFASRYVVVLGEVAQPGLQPIDRDYRLSEIVARAGGITASGVDTVSLTRESGEQLQVSLQDMATGGLDKDPMVAPGDRIFVARMQEEDRKVFYIYGQVTAPGSYPLAEGMSLRMALARGGGLTPLGSEKKVEVFRNGEEVRDVDLSDTVQIGDVIRVGERFF